MKCKYCKLVKCECFYSCLSCFEHAGNCKCYNEIICFVKLSPGMYKKLNDGLLEPDEKIFN